MLPRVFAPPLAPLVPLAGLAALTALAALFACSSSSDNGVAGDPDAGVAPVEEASAPIPVADASHDAAKTRDLWPMADVLVGCARDPGAPAGTVDPSAKSDPTGGPMSFTMAKAMAGFPVTASDGKLVAAIATEKSTILCELDEAHAPISVANFVGLARGTRPYRIDGGKWQLGRFYDGLTWHRVVPDFVIQGGDPDGDGTGGPGYSMVPENHVDEPLGTLAMAASDVPSGSQFYIVVGQGPNAAYNVFGSCTTEVAIAIAEVHRDAHDKPNDPIHMTRVDIARCPWK
jgi:peptidyl-prolyl cis-trans isomerase A (cyclophilin A)